MNEKFQKGRCTGRGPKDQVTVHERDTEDQKSRRIPNCYLHGWQEIFKQKESNSGPIKFY